MNRRVLTAVATVALVAVEVVAAPGHVPGLGALAGLAGGFALVGIAKALGKAGLQRPEPPDE